MSHLQTIKQFVLDEFLPDVPAGDLTTDLDLVATGVVDSLGLLKLIAWIEDRFQLDADELDLDPDSLRSVESINAFVLRSTAQAASR